MAHEVAHAFGDVGAQPGWHLALARWPEGAPDRHQRGEGHQVGERAAGERERDREAGEHAAERRADELVHHHLGAVHAAVGPVELAAVDDHRDDRLRRGVEQGLADAEGEGHDVEEEQALGLDRDDEREATDEHDPRHVDPDHRAEPVEPVGQRTGLEREEQPGQPGRERDPGHGARRAGDAQREQGERDLEDAVGQVRQRGGGEQLPVGRAEGRGGHVLRMTPVIGKSQSV